VIAPEPHAPARGDRMFEDEAQHLASGI